MSKTRIGMLVLLVVALSSILTVLAVSPRTLPLKVTLILERPTVRIGEPLNMTLELSNTGSETRSLNYRNSHTNDVYLFSRDMKLVTYLSKGCLFLQVLTSITLEPGETREWHFSWTSLWEEDIEPGKYYLQGEVFHVPKTTLEEITILANTK